MSKKLGRRYLVGYAGCPYVYGSKTQRYLDLLTAGQACREAMDLPDLDGRVFELVDVTDKLTRPKAKRKVGKKAKK